MYHRICGVLDKVYFGALCDVLAHLVAGLDAEYAFSNGLDYAASLMPENGRESALWVLMELFKTNNAR